VIDEVDILDDPRVRYVVGVADGGEVTKTVKINKITRVPIW
jgi:hypothetical protein